MARARGAAAASAGKAGCGSSGRPRARQRPPQGKRRSKPRPEVNSRPEGADQQDIPFRLREIMRSRQEMKAPLSNKKRRKQAQVTFKKTLEQEAKGEEPDIPVPKFKRRKWESDRAYVQRMEQEAQHVLFLTKNQAARRPEVQVPARKSERQKAFQRRRLDKVRQRKEDQAADRLERELLRDTVKFGEVVLQPPELTAKPRKSIGQEEPGKKSLLLRSLWSPRASQPPRSSLARERIVREERERAVQAYRALKRQKQPWQGPQPARPRGPVPQKREPLH
ncbi:coiled-coil domain-containing protein 137 [Lepus europaeus]|uniref:coiled-coil domain-containing protein 137 n=1 Tax=Lepus europaeus TaxID=9983 RepID=UPI002B45BD67|nr:coiled-coil domain-containing protein 137 [Lepus europaeus]